MILARYAIANGLCMRQVHPDKNPGADATEAFEALKQAHRLLKDPGELVRGVRS